MEKNRLLFFEGLSGSAALNTALELFYFKIKNDRQISPRFYTFPKAKKQSSVNSLVLSAFGPSIKHVLPERFNENSAVKLTELNYHQVARHLISSLQEVQVEQHLIHEIMLAVLGAKSDILSE